MDTPNFLENKEGWWDGLISDGWPGYAFMNKLKQLKRILNPWNRDHFGQIDKEKKEMIDQIGEIDDEEGKGSMSSEKRRKRIELKATVLNLIIKKQRYWVQKCKVKSLKEGGENINFFHKWASMRKCQNYISMLEKEDDDIILSIVKEVVKFIEALYS